jgi:hypothetical protein
MNSITTKLVKIDHLRFLEMQPNFSFQSEGGGANPINFDDALSFNIDI